jgi:hypothetical protein
VNGQPVACQCGPTTTCTNGMKGTCSVQPTTLYRDVDGDGYGLAGTASQQCPGAAGYSSNSNDCDDNNASFKPGASVCVNPNTSDQRLTCLSNGTTMPSTCSDGCLNGSCRSDGTIGLPGYVSCTTSSTPRCPVSIGCDLGTGLCGIPGSNDNYFLKCDGQNDCPSGQTCCLFVNRGINTADCYVGGCPTGSGYSMVCDPLAPVCPASPSSCTKFSITNVYECG